VYASSGAPTSTRGEGLRKLFPSTRPKAVTTQGKIEEKLYERVVQQGKNGPGGNGGQVRLKSKGVRCLGEGIAA